MTASNIAWTVIAIGAIPATLFPVVYFFRPWRRTWTGRGLMSLSFGMLLLFDLSITSHLLGHGWPGFRWVAVGVYALIAFGLWVLFLSLLSSRRDQ